MRKDCVTKTDKQKTVAFHHEHSHIPVPENPLILKNMDYTTAYNGKVLNKWKSEFYRLKGYL